MEDWQALVAIGLFVALLVYAAIEFVVKPAGRAYRQWKHDPLEGVEYRR